MDNFITKELIFLDLEVYSKDEAIMQMAKLLEKQGKINDYNVYIKEVFDRENDFPTVLGHKVAIPHGKTRAVNCAAVVFARLKNEVQWSEDEFIKYVFLIAVPEAEAGDTHLQILSMISTKLMRAEFRDILKNASEIDELIEAFAG